MLHIIEYIIRCIEQIIYRRGGTDDDECNA